MNDRPKLDTYNRPLSITAMTLVGLAGSSIAIIIPSLIDALSRFRGLDTSAAASVMSGELLGMTVATAVVAPAVRRFDRRWIAVLAIALCALADLGSMAPIYQVSTLYALRLAAGFGEGAMIAAVAAALGGTALPDRNFAIFVACNMLLSAVMFRVLPPLLAGFGINGMFGALLVLLAVAATALPFFPGRAPVRATGLASAGTANQSPLNLTVLFALLGVLVFFTASGTVWPLMPYFAGKLHVADATVASTLSNATLAGMMAALLASFVGARWGRSAPLLVAAALLISCMLALTALGGGIYAVAVAVFMGAYMFSTPYYYATLAAADASGRAVAFSMSVQFAGLTLGPLLGPRLNAYANGFGSIWAGIVLMVVAVALISIAGSRLRRST
jgi:MFS family permease